MNQHKRRRAKKPRISPGLVVNIRLGRCLMAGDGKVECFVCGEEARKFF